MAVALLPVTHENVDAVCELAVHEHQRRFVAPAAKTVAEAKCHEPGAFLRAITVDGRPIGVVWVQTDEPVPYLVRFMIDAAWQARGIGRGAVGLLLAALRLPVDGPHAWRGGHRAHGSVAGSLDQQNRERALSCFAKRLRPLRLAPRGLVARRDDARCWPTGRRQVLDAEMRSVAPSHLPPPPSPRSGSVWPFSPARHRAARRVRRSGLRVRGRSRGGTCSGSRRSPRPFPSRPLGRGRRRRARRRR